MTCFFLLSNCSLSCNSFLLYSIEFNGIYLIPSLLFFITLHSFAIRKSRQDNQLKLQFKRKNIDHHRKNIYCRKIKRCRRNRCRMEERWHRSNVKHQVDPCASWALKRLFFYCLYVCMCYDETDLKFIYFLFTLSEVIDRS